jgi:hypothetical protein
VASIAYEVVCTDFGPSSDSAGDAQTEVREAGHAGAQARRVYKAAAEKSISMLWPARRWRRLGTGLLFEITEGARIRR